ncbi:MAG: AMP-binding protein [Steroidobacter sp.]
MSPLFIHASASDTLIWHQGEKITRGGFTHAARQLAARLPQATHAINLCNGRLAFMLGFAAAALRQQVTLLPPNQTAIALEALKQQYPVYQVLDDTLLEGLDWKNVDNNPLLIPSADHIAAILFTSGSTGVPQPQAKSWYTLLRTGQLDSQRLLQLSTSSDIALNTLNIVATVPSQHMFGLQTTLLLPLASNCAVYDGKPFFPADIRAALESVPEPRALVTTPLHLQTCITSKTSLPRMQFILSATAPLNATLAQQAEDQWQTSVLEFYGSTEAGAIGTRRTTAGDTWQLLPEARLEITNDGTRYYIPHLPEPLPLNDQVELVSMHEFRLLGRAGDQLKIAGKRASISELTHALQTIPGVEDGVVFLPPDASRTAALAVAPRLTAAFILDQLAQRVDPVFLPRPLLLLSRLPRNDVGKLTQAALLAALESGS